MKRIVLSIFTFMIVISSIVTISANEYQTNQNFKSQEQSITHGFQTLFMNTTCDTSTVYKFGDTFDCAVTISHNSNSFPMKIDGIPTSSILPLFSITTGDNFTIEHVSATNLDQDEFGNDVPTMDGDVPLAPAEGLDKNDIESGYYEDFHVEPTTTGYNFYLTDRPPFDYYSGEVRLDITFSLNEMTPETQSYDIQTSSVNNEGTVANPDGMISSTYTQNYNTSDGWYVGNQPVYTPVNRSSLIFNFNTRFVPERATVVTDPQIENANGIGYNGSNAYSSLYTYMLEFPNLEERATIDVSVDSNTNDEYDIFIDPNNTGDTSWTIENLRYANTSPSVIIDMTGFSPYLQDLEYSNESYNMAKDGTVNFEFVGSNNDLYLRNGSDSLISISEEFDASGKTFNGYLGSGYPVPKDVTDIYGNPVTVNPTKINFYYGQQKPNIETQSTVEIDRGTAVDLMDYVTTATDGYGVDVTNDVQYTSNPEFKGDGTDKPGTYEITYTLDNQSATTVLTVNAVEDVLTVFELSKYEESVPEGSIITYPSVIALNQFDESMSDQVVVDYGNFKNDGTDAPGTYVITYSLNNQKLEYSVTIEPAPLQSFEVTPSEVNIIEGQIVDEPTVTAVNNGGYDISDQVTVDYGEFKNDGTDEPGVYEITYTVRDEVINATVIIEENSLTEFNLSSESTEIIESQIAELPEVTAVDSLGNDVSVDVVIDYGEFKNDGTDKPGTYEITYSLKGEQLIYTVTVLENSLTVFSLSKESTEIMESQIAELPKVTAVDSLGNDVSDDVVIQYGEFKNDGTDKPGTYKITYSLKGEQLTYTVTVLENSLTEFSLSNESTEIVETQTAELPEVTAVDSLGNDVSDDVVIDYGKFKNDGTDKPGTYEITYSLKGEQLTYTVTVLENTLTEFSLSVDHIEATEGEIVEMPKVIAVDSFGNDVSDDVVVDYGEFKNDGTDKPGTYDIIYTYNTDLRSSFYTVLTVTINDIEDPEITPVEPGETNNNTELETEQDSIGVKEPENQNSEVNITESNNSKSKLNETGSNNLLSIIVVLILTIAIIFLTIHRKNI